MKGKINLAGAEETLLAKIIEVYALLYTESERPLDEQFAKAVARAFFLGRPALVATAKEHLRVPEKAEIVLGLDAERKTFGMTIRYAASNARPVLLLTVALLGLVLVLIAGAGILYALKHS